MGFICRAMLLPLCLAALWVGGLWLYVMNMPQQPTSDTRHADAIVVLTGGKNRLEYGLMRLSEGKAQTLFISGVAKGVTTADILRTADAGLLKNIDVRKLAARIVLGFEATSTIENAKETAQWAKTQHVKTIRLVTANYHMPRARREFAQAAPELEVITDPIFPEDFDRLRWWQNETSIRLAVNEFHKFLGSQLRHFLLSDT